MKLEKKYNQMVKMFFQHISLKVNQVLIRWQHPLHLRLALLSILLYKQLEPGQPECSGTPSCLAEREASSSIEEPAAASA